ncbi:hypothetical protein ACIOWI_33040 [Streptomyces sp. NPDC087659]|uniref:hypothetical protein n=1 Tax=Streptomyces sp. NPDC087659 TaxID=3365801 RepID=UPI00382D4B5C
MSDDVARQQAVAQLEAARQQAQAALAAAQEAAARLAESLALQAQQAAGGGQR